MDVALGVGRLRLVDAHEGHPVATAFHFTWGQDLKWQLQSVATSDEGRRVYFRLEGKVHWLEEPLVDSRARREQFFKLPSCFQAGNATRV